VIGAAPDGLLPPANAPAKVVGLAEDPAAAEPKSPLPLVAPPNMSVLCYRTRHFKLAGGLLNKLDVP
jgi:hypothetical protein